MFGCPFVSRDVSGEVGGSQTRNASQIANIEDSSIRPKDPMAHRGSLYTTD